MTPWLACAIDLIAVGWGGVSAYCLSPAYWLLIPAYGTLWAAGRWYQVFFQAESLGMGASGLAALA